MLKEIIEATKKINEKMHIFDSLTQTSFANANASPSLQPISKQFSAPKIDLTKLSLPPSAVPSPGSLRQRQLSIPFTLQEEIPDDISLYCNTDKTMFIFDGTIDAKLFSS